MLQDSRITSGSTGSLLNFLSYHHYYSVNNNEAVANWKNAAKNYNAALINFPVYITEWNWDWRYIGTPLNNDHPDAVSFAGKRLTDFYKLQANGANVFADNDQVTDSDFFGVYANGFQTPRSNAFRLLSKDLGLGVGNGTIRDIAFSSPVTNAGGCYQF
ncbi:hypothetical protein [Cohnella rhizosphaerae]|uniref:Uncharacterized protein n=1 Tax=Cohnella rhizosphaerae TaxID=1457232 RepID=A0A9X4KT27_9BACL|nr:hypothetical protein [Cohnella rhizosphaerae]MDG0810465.1 hypothetical protein [Cohnella rhizosphaerae]